MTSNVDDLKVDLKQALEDIESQLPERKVETLLMVFEKHLNLNQGVMMMDKSDLDMIRSYAVKELVDTAFPKYLGKDKKEVLNNEANVLCIIEATIRHFNGKGCFNKQPKFDYTERKKA